MGGIFISRKLYKAKQKVNIWQILYHANLNQANILVMQINSWFIMTRHSNYTKIDHVQYKAITGSYTKDTHKIHREHW